MSHPGEPHSGCVFARGRKGKVPSPAAAEVGLFSSSPSSPAARGAANTGSSEQSPVRCRAATTARVCTDGRCRSCFITSQIENAAIVFLQSVCVHLRSQDNSCFFNQISLWLGLLGPFFFIPWLVRSSPSTSLHYAPAACCSRFPEPFRDPAFVSAVILAIFHHSDSLVGFLCWKCLRRAESLQPVAPAPAEQGCTDWPPGFLYPSARCMLQ